MTESKLNLGCGGQIRPGWVNLDRAFDGLAVQRAAVENLGEGDHDAIALHEHDLLSGPLPFEDGRFRCVAAHHVLDMFEDEELAWLICEVARVLEPGGVLRVSSPDYENAIRALVQRDSAWFDRLGVPFQPSIEQTFAWYLTWGEARKTVLYSAAQLGVEYLTPAGLGWDLVAFHETTSATPSITELDSRADESWFLEARKP